MEKRIRQLFLELLNQRDATKQNELASMIAASVDLKDTQEFISAMGNESIEEVEGATRILAALARTRREWLTKPTIELLRQRMNQVLRKHYPRTAGNIALQCLHNIAEQDSEAFLLKDLELTGLSRKEAFMVISELSRFASKSTRALDRLRELARREDEAALQAEVVLDEYDPVLKKQALQKYSKRWRESRDQQALNWLYSNYLVYLPRRGGTLAEVKSLLGDPDGSDEKAVWYHPTSESVVYLSVDDEGKITATRESG
jgi:hypothetical protein